MNATPGVSTLELSLDDSYRRAVDELVVDTAGDVVAAPSMVVFNDALAEELGFGIDLIEHPDLAGVLAGSTPLAGSRPVAMAYAGHQFGGFSPQLGDGRAILLGEWLGPDDQRWDLHLKGSGRTPFSRGGDGKAVLGPMLREYLFAEAMHALGIRSTRALAVVTTGEDVVRDGLLPGAVLTRVAASHLRVGTFEFVARHPEPSLLPRLVDVAIARHYPFAAASPSPALGLLEAVLEAQAELVASWMLVGFVHGVLNTDNSTISGETIDYGPCAFLDGFDPNTVFSSIDHGGRYAYGNQPGIIQWNLTRLAESLLRSIDDDTEQAVAAATEVLKTFPERYQASWREGMAAKLGVPANTDPSLFDDYLQHLADNNVDYTTSFRDLARSLRGAPDALVGFGDGFMVWRDRWMAAIDAEHGAVADLMDMQNPQYIPRNHLVEEALDAANRGELEPFCKLFAVVTDPYTQMTDGDEYFRAPASTEFTARFQTYCGT